MKRPISKLLSLALICSVLNTGCHRGYYRREADADAQSLIYQKMNDPRWNQIDPSISVAPDSRMHDPFSADHPPLPPDDPISHELMECTDNKRNYPHWHANGDTCVVENPMWRSYLPLNEQGVLELDLDTAVRLSLIHSPLYQRQKESLYLSALDVSLERFGFDTQAFSSWNTFFRTQAPLAPGGSQSLLDLSTGANRIRLQKLGTTGANLIVGMANTIMWNFAGPNTQTASTLIDFSFFQPLLRGGGRDRIMESLTQSERALLANVRQMERFRRGFYLNITTGRSAGAGPGLIGLAEPGFGIVSAGGYLGLLLNQQQIRISEFNVRSLQNVINQFREFFEEQRIDLFQVRLAESSLYNAQSGLLQDKVGYENSLDQFKRDLGLPPDLPVVVIDPFLEQFELIADELLQRQFDVNALRDIVGLALSEVDASNIDEQDPDDPDADPLRRQLLTWDDDLRQALLNIKPLLDQIGPLRQKIIDEDVQLVRDDFARLDAMREQRLTKLAKLRQLTETSEINYDIEPRLLEDSEVAEAGDLLSELDELLLKIDEIPASVEIVKANIDDIIAKAPGLSDEELTDRIEDEVLFETPEILTRLANQIIELTLLQARSRTDSIVLPDVNLKSEVAIEIARQFRRDWMNARAALVDRWRQIEFFADDLESTLDLVIDGSIGNVGDNPFKIRWDTNTYGMGLRFDAPITRLAERNRYRQALIDYQRDRRAYYSFEDSIKQNLRRTLRNLEQSQILFELNRRSIKIAVQRVETAQLALIQPVRPGAGGSPLGPTAADNLTSSLNALQQAQNQFLAVWVGYEVARRGLDFDLGTMLMTPDGYWLDPGTIDESVAYRAAEAFGIPFETLCLPATGPLDEQDPGQTPLNPDMLDLLPESNDGEGNGALGLPGEIGRVTPKDLSQQRAYRPVRLTAILTPESKRAVSNTIQKLPPVSPTVQR